MTLRVAMPTLYPMDECQVGGGIRMVSLNLVRAMGQVPGLDLHVIHCHGDCKSDRMERQHNATIHYLATPRSHLVPNLTASVARVSRLLRKLRPHVVHAHVGHLAFAGVRAGIPTIYTIHGVVAREREIYGQRLYDRLRYGLLDLYERRALARVSGLVAISDHVRQAYEQQRGDLIRDVPWTHIDNPVPDEFFHVEDIVAKPTILYVGSITEIKDLETLLRAFERVWQHVPNVCLRIAGRVTSQSYYSVLTEYVKECGLETQVSFLGLLDRESLLREYRRASLVALSSLQENAPMAVIEAMAAAKPVVATSVGGVPGLVQDGETGWLVSAGDDAEMARKMQELLQNDGDRRAMGLAARQVARRRFGADQVAQSYVALYRRVVAGRDA